MNKNKGISKRLSGPVWGRELIHPKLGSLSLLVSEKGLMRVGFCSLDETNTYISISGSQMPADIEKMLDISYLQISEYLAGERKIFDLPLDWSVMTHFQASVLKIVYAIPYGTIKTYGEIAAVLQKPGASRAVGTANARNPIPLIVPCHRVVGSDRKMHGFSAPGGLETKAWLLQLEGLKVVDQKLA